jgi:hypothetical protein
MLVVPLILWYLEYLVCPVVRVALEALEVRVGTNFLHWDSTVGRTEKVLVVGTRS